MKTTENTATVSSLEELVNTIYHQLGSMGLYYHLSNGEVDVEEIIFDIATPLPTVYPCTLTIKCVYDVDVDTYLEFIYD